MNITETRDNDKLALHIDGKIDTVSAPILNEYLAKSISGVKELTLDFSKVPYVSSAGLRTLLVAQKMMSKQGKMFVSNVNKEIMETFEMTCFTDILTII